MNRLLRGQRSRPTASTAPPPRLRQLDPAGRRLRDRRRLRRADGAARHRRGRRRGARGRRPPGRARASGGRRQPARPDHFHRMERSYGPFAAPSSLTARRRPRPRDRAASRTGCCGSSCPRRASAAAVRGSAANDEAAGAERAGVPRQGARRDPAARRTSSARRSWRRRSACSARSASGWPASWSGSTSSRRSSRSPIWAASSGVPARRPLASRDRPQPAGRGAARPVRAEPRLPGARCEGTRLQLAMSDPHGPRARRRRSSSRPACAWRP